MTYSASELKAERSILRAMGLAAVFTTYSGATSKLDVLRVDEYSAIKTGDFVSRDRDTRFEALAEDLPQEWRDGKLTVAGRDYNVLDVTFDEYGIRAKIRAE